MLAHLRRVAAIAVVVAAAALPAQAQTQSLKVGYLPVTGHAKFFVAKEQGFFAKEGLDVELIEFVNSADGANAVIAGKLDIGAFGTTAPLAHIAKGTDLKIIGGIMGEDASIVTLPAVAPSVQKVGDLKGKKIATIRMATGDAVLRGALKEAGLDWRTDVQIFELKSPPAVLEAVKSGQVDAGVVWGPHDLRAEEQGLKIVIRSSSLQPGHPCCRLIVTSERYQSRDTWERFLRAILRAEKFAQENRKETIDATAKYVKLDRSLLERGYYQPHLDQTSDPNVRGVKVFWETMKASDFIQPKGDVLPQIDVKLYEAALSQLAKENPGDPFWKKLQQEFRQKDVL
jgi:NitT/TauT family transport system substrate-binding protein